MVYNFSATFAYRAWATAPNHARGESQRTEQGEASADLSGEADALFQSRHAEGRTRIENEQHSPRVPADEGERLREEDSTWDLRQREEKSHDSDAVELSNQAQESLEGDEQAGEEEGAEGEEEEVEEDPSLPVDPTLVCAIASNPRQGSIFRTNYMAKIGSGKYTYRVGTTKTCPWGAPRIRMVPFVKCCTQLSAVHNTIVKSQRSYDIIIVTGDEYCMVRSTGIFQYRQYHGDSVIGRGGVSKLDKARIPKFFPLGPRAEFKHVNPKLEVIPILERKYALNFVGSPTSIPRRELRDYFASDAWLTSDLAQKSFVHVTDRWVQRVSVSKGYLPPERYRQVVLDSAFTLCPMGHNPEAYRIYEATEAQSIPILCLGEESYLGHACSNAYQPFLDSNAPFIFLNDWSELQAFMDGPGSNATFLEERQTLLRKWYKTFLSDFAKEFESLLEFRFEKRMRLPKPRYKVLKPLKP